MKKHRIIARLISLVLTVLLVLGMCIAPSKDVKADSATYPLFVPMKFETTGYVGDTIEVEFGYIPYYANEITHVEVYNSSGTLVASAEKQWYHTSRLNKKYTVTWDTSGKAAGTYTVLSYVEYYSTYFSEWLISSNSKLKTLITLSRGSSNNSSYSDDSENERTNTSNPFGNVKPYIYTIKNRKGKKLSLAWDGSYIAEGYQVQYAMNRSFSKNMRTKTTKKESLTLKRLKKRKTYYVRVRAYTYNSYGKKVYSKWSKVRKVKIKK